MTRDELAARLIGVNLRFRVKIRQRPTRTSTEASTASTVLTVSRRTTLASLTISSPYGRLSKIAQFDEA